MIRCNRENSKISMKSLGKELRWPGIEPGSNAWKASMLTITPPTLGLRYLSESVLYITQITSISI